MYPLSKRCGAEFFGTFWLVLGGCGAAVLAAGFPQLGIGFAGVALAFGLTVLTMAFAVGHISGGHFNPAAAAVLAVIADGKLGFDLKGSHFAANGYGAYSPGKYSMAAALVTEIVMTAGFLFVILGATAKRAPAGFAAIPIGLALTLIHLVSIPVTNTSVNPARSTGPALFVGGWALEQLWLFWVAPIVGAIIGALAYRLVSEPASQA